MDISIVQYNYTGGDYNLDGSDLTLSTTATSTVINIGATDDTILEGDETFTIALDISSLSTLYPDTSFTSTSPAMVTIVDDEGMYELKQ